ncbi:ABC transporter permease [Paenibacillus macquariensis]|uniref:Aldouronate transport system permease protein n=1 Tax=Paenibacillus macquariensis TaxID=948756 RepID=A0ABY1JKU4_9BACL|nr:ABC transporter permease subunit [Paenibacillus macquariensis]MEC0090017.1 ABC transporter permease subunit [Paenibacillus macquariensis]OAB31099.1 sugar ABC transporter permease [Paenibacillus macquariensis subsp. macquariensis]SIQ36186.1 putative aldouronate transport system permease protein [Paenibacillus macquariensis]
MQLRELRKDFRKNKVLLALTLPLVIYVFIFSYVPMFGAIVAFKRYQFNKGILGSDWVGLSNFKFLFESPDLWRIVRNTLGYNTVFIILNLLGSVFVALLLYEITSKKLLKVYQSIMFYPHFLSWVVVAYMAYAFLNPRSGMLNQWLSDLGLGAVDWYNKSGPWIYIMPLANMWKEIGVSAIIYYAGLLGVDPTYYEAAKIDGASKWKIITKISVPFLYPLMTILTILAIGHIFSADFGLFYQLPMNSPTIFSSTDVIDTYIFRALIDNGNIGMSSAAGLTKSILGLLLVLGTNAVVRKINSDNSLF